jgi:putative cell wall-binding protein
LKVTQYTKFASVQMLCNPCDVRAHDVIILNVDAFADVVQAIDVSHQFAKDYYNPDILRGVRGRVC